MQRGEIHKPPPASSLRILRARLGKAEAAVGATAGAALAAQRRGASGPVGCLAPRGTARGDARLSPTGTQLQECAEALNA